MKLQVHQYKLASQNVQRIRRLSVKTAALSRTPLYPLMPAGPSAERLWRGLRQCPTWGCVRLRDCGQESTATRTSSNETRGNVIPVHQI
jgi:hypothetical protein